MNTARQEPTEMKTSQPGNASFPRGMNHPDRPMPAGRPMPVFSDSQGLLRPNEGYERLNKGSAETMHRFYVHKSFSYASENNDVATHFVHHHENWFASMDAEEQAVLTVDPMVNILSAFYSIPNNYTSDLFNDFRDAAESRDLRQLLDTISDWAATAEIYAHSHLAAELQAAIQARKGNATCLSG